MSLINKVEHFSCFFLISTFLSACSFVWCQHQAEFSSPQHHFQPFLDALSLQIPSKLKQQPVEVSIPPRQKTYTIKSSPKAAFASIITSSSRMENPNKLPLYRGKRPIQTTNLLMQSDAQELSLSLKYLSSLNRFNVNSKTRARKYISDTFRNFGLNVTEQKFKAPYIENEGINIIGIRKGTAKRKQRGRERLHSPGNDQIVALVIGAHYDTVKNTSGLNDNGSGIGIMLEMVRLLESCQTTYSVIFVAFDQEELGAIGSKYFVNEYLIPSALSNVQYRSHFKGAIIMDTLLNFDAQPGTQDIPNDIHLTVPGFSTAIKQSNYSGNFLAMFARTNIDQYMSKLIEEKWKNHDYQSTDQKGNSEIDWKQYQLRPVSIRSLSKSKVASFNDLQRHVNMLRSDHLHFWYHNHSSYPSSLGAVLLTDTGPFRGYMRYCYHKMCDDSRFLSEKNVNFVRKTVDVLMQVVLTITQGSCLTGEENINENLAEEEEEEFKDKNANAVRKSNFIDQMFKNESNNRLKDLYYERGDNNNNQLVVHLAKKLLKAVSGSGAMETPKGRLKRQRCRKRRSLHGVLVKDWLWLLDHLLKKFAVNQV